MLYGQETKGPSLPDNNGVRRTRGGRRLKLLNTKRTRERDARGHTDVPGGTTVGRECYVFINKEASYK